jgi:2-polyprenyl-3-methyl-5-hydroxy-6-metoxy-1,4-benzoquinol methylase
MNDEWNEMTGKLTHIGEAKISQGQAPSTPSASCPLCAHADARPYVQSNFNLTGATAKTYQVVECCRCQMRYVHPQPSARELAQFYADDYPAYHLSAPGDRPVSAEEAAIQHRLQRVAARRLALLGRFQPPPWTGRRVLDIGCGNGAFLLELIRHHPVEAWGMDLAQEVVNQIARLDARIRMVTGSLADAPLPRGYFDVITLWHVLEHDGDPVSSLRRIAEWLRPGGLLIAEVPNASGMIARLCGSSWLGWDLPRHLVHFAPSTLRQAAERAGWTDVRVVRAYTLNPVAVSPLLASLAIRRRRRQGRTHMRRVRYHRLNGVTGVALRLVNGVEWLLGGNGLVLVARKSEVRGQRSEVRGQRSEVRGQKSGV